MSNLKVTCILTMALVTAALEFARFQATQTCERAGHILQEDQRDLRLQTDGVIGGTVMTLDCGDWWGSR
jgi:hypothetical protein